MEFFKLEKELVDTFESINDEYKRADQKRDVYYKEFEALNENMKTSQGCQRTMIDWWANRSGFMWIERFTISHSLWPGPPPVNVDLVRI